MTKLYTRISPPADMRDECLDATYYVPNTRDGHKVANLLHDFLAEDERRELFKVAKEEDTEDLAEAYKKLQEQSDSSKEDEEDRGEEDEEDGGEEDEIYGDDSFVSLE